LLDKAIDEQAVGNLPSHGSPVGTRQALADCWAFAKRH
jgi:hypothetical protein